ncbi:High-affinity Na(+)/H(+) antiporter NhaS3 [Gimesia panareensis]|uniref:High-affinity Na(+)/H(+) antiporter NhaS3 n=1 Tax=Gimesia panareensis TaxID=2527978 RepID=A0A518FMP5_9PLAN|nr:cation:proton antiporter [Gimesia panareensis]QDV17535.1 High-affinity Na(+)/H(+) antiporter NhaS3 [Gimesia panareensis]
MELLYILLVLLIVTRLFGEIFARLSQPVLAGELLSGVILGVIVKNNERWFPILSDLSENQIFEAVTDLGIFFLMLLAGIEMRPRDLAQTSGSALIVALGGMLFPMTLGMGLGYFSLPDSDWKTAQMFFLGVALSITAVPITIATLMELGQQHSRLGRMIISAAVFDDIFSLFLLAVLTSLLNQTGGLTPGSFGILTGKIILFFIITLVAGRWLFPWLNRIAHKHLQTKHVEFTMLMTSALAFSVLAEMLEMHFILGAFTAGLFFTRQSIEETLHRDVHVQVEAITLGFFAPLFFASIGLSINLDAITATPVFLFLLILTAFIGKMLGAGLAAKFCGLPRTEALAVGIGMNARGAVELIVADIAWNAGLFNYPEPAPPVVSNLFSSVVIMAILATILSPMALRLILSQTGTNNAAYSK